jgi:enediyne biosynthesis protein E4
MKLVTEEEPLVARSWRMIGRCRRPLSSPEPFLLYPAPSRQHFERTFNRTVAMRQHRFPLPVLLLTLIASIVAVSSARAQDTTWFRDITAKSGLEGAKGGQISALDVNADGYPDLLLQNLAYNRGMKTRFLLNLQDPSSSDPKDRIFVDRTDSMGVYANPQAGVTGRIADVWAMADVNGDGHPDIVTGLFYYTVATFQDSGDRAEVLLNDGTGRFRLVANNGLHELGKFPSTGFCFLDYDLDGKLDVYITVFSADHQNNEWIPGFLMKGNGDGTFRDVTAESGIDQVAEPNYGATVTDWNNDGWPDILTCPYCRTNGTLWRNNGDGTFTDATDIANYTSKNGMTGNVDPGIGARELCQWEALPADYDNDGDMDVAQMLVHGGLGATEGRSPLSINSGAAGGYRLEWDMKKFDRPLISQIKTWRDTLTSSSGADSIVTYRTPLGTGHLGDQAGSWLDFDNDMLQDIIISTTGYDPAQDRAYMNRQNADHSFTDIAKVTGLSKWLRPAHSNRPFDFDLDGDDDLAVIFAPLAQYVPPEDRARANQVLMVRNDAGNRNNHVTVKLTAPAQSNRNAIGARIYVYAGGVRQMREIQSGVGRWGMMQPFELNFGLAQSTSIDSIVVRWPMRGLPTSSVVNPPINQVVEIDGTSIVTGVDGETGPALTLGLAPNPTSDWMTARLPAALRSGAALEVYDAMGVLRSTTPLAGAEYVRVPVESLPTGYYVVRVVAGGETRATASFIRSL